MRTRFFYPTGAEIDQGFFDMCLKSWPLRAEDLIRAAEIDHPQTVVAEFTGYLRLIDDSGHPVQVATEIGIDAKNTGLRIYTMRTLIFGRTLEMSLAGELSSREHLRAGVVTAAIVAQVAMGLTVGISGVARVMNACDPLVSVFPSLAKEIEGAYPIHAAMGYDFLTEWDLHTHKRALGLLAKERVGPLSIDRVMAGIDKLGHAWELAEFEIEGQKLGEMYFTRAGRWSGRIDLTPGSPGRARAERFVAQHGRQYASQDAAIQN